MLNDAAALCPVEPPALGRRLRCCCRTHRPDEVAADAELESDLVEQKL